MNNMTQNQIHLFGDRVREQILNKAAGYERATRNLIKVVYVPDGVGPVTVGVLMRKSTMAHKQQHQLGWA